MASAEGPSSSDEGQNELRLELRAVEGGYQVKVHWPSCADEVEYAFALEPARVDETLARVGRGAGRRIARAPEGGSLDPLRDLGERLFLSLIEGGLGSRYRQALAQPASRELRLCVATADRRIADLPWEVLYDRKRQDFVALSVRTPLVRRWLADGEAGEAGEGGKARQAAEVSRSRAGGAEGPVGAAPGLLVVDASGTSGEIIDALGKASGLRASPVVKAGSPADLLRAVAGGSEPLLLFLGPAAEDRARAVGPRLACAGGELEAPALLGALRERRRAGRPPLRFAFWCGSDTDAFAREVAPGLAASAGVRAALTGRGAAAFVISLYREFAAGKSLATAFTEARQRVDRERNSDREWVLPVLYLQEPAGLGRRRAGESRIDAGGEAEGDHVRLAGLRVEMHRRNVDALRAAVAPEAGGLREPFAEQLEAAQRELAGAEEQAEFVSARGPTELAKAKGEGRRGGDADHAYPLPSEGYVRDLLRAVLTIDARGEQLAQLNALAEPLRRTGLVKAPGELGLLATLRSLHEGARKRLPEMDRSKSEAGPHVRKLERELAAVEWELAAELEASLEAKGQRLRLLVEGYNRGYDEASTALGELRQAIAEASKFKAPLERELGRWRALKDMQRAVGRALRDGQYENALEPLAGLQHYRERQHQRALRRVHLKQEAARAICRHADLLFLRAPPSGRRRHEYTVLLRTPAEPGAQSVNVRASTTLVEQDRQHILEAAKEYAEYLGGEIVRHGAARDVAPELGSLRLPRGGRPPAASMRDVGELMYRLFMPEEMQRYIDETPCSLTITTNDLELPWELMSQGDAGHASGRGDEFLCLRRPVARLPMGHAFPRRDRGAAPRRDRLRFLLIHSGANTGLPVLHGAAREVQVVREELLRRWRDRIDVTVLDGGDVTGKALNGILREGAFDVIHYAGHAYADEKQGDLSGLVLKDGEIFFAQKVRRLLEGRPLVFLNACQSAALGADEPPAVGAHAQAEGLASAFLYGGAVACIGSLWPIFDAPAAAFATAFYRYVLEGHMIGEAVRRARRSVYLNHGGDPTWASFVLYGNPTYRHTPG